MPFNKYSQMLVYLSCPYGRLTVYLASILKTSSKRWIILNLCIYGLSFFCNMQFHEIYHLVYDNPSLKAAKIKNAFTSAESCSSVHAFQWLISILDGPHAVLFVVGDFSLCCERKSKKKYWNMHTRLGKKERKEKKPRIAVN